MITLLILTIPPELKPWLVLLVILMGIGGLALIIRRAPAIDPTIKQWLSWACFAAAIIVLFVFAMNKLDAW